MHINDDDRMGGDETADDTQKADTGSGSGAPAGKGADDSGKGSAQADSAGKAPPADTAKLGDADWLPNDWRDKLVNGFPEDQRGKAKDYVTRRNSPYEIIRSGMTADAKIKELTETRIKLPTGKDDDPKELAAFRQKWGVPADAKEYKADIPKEVGELSDLDQELLDEFKKDAHTKNYSQDQFAHAVKMYWAVDQRVKAAQVTQVVKAQQAAVDELRVEFGKDYRPTVELINRMFETELSAVGMTEADERREFLSQRFTNGMALGEHPAFVKMMAKIARERADDGAFVMGETSDGVDIEAKIDKIIETRNTDMKAYERMQPELKRLIAAQERMKARGKR